MKRKTAPSRRNPMASALALPTHRNRKVPPRKGRGAVTPRARKTDLFGDHG